MRFNIHPVLGSVIHWSLTVGKFHCHFGIHRFGNCWKFWPSITRYNTCTFYGFWKLFFSVSK